MSLSEPWLRAAMTLPMSSRMKPLLLATTVSVLVLHAASSATLLKMSGISSSSSIGRYFQGNRLQGFIQSLTASSVRPVFNCFALHLLSTCSLDLDFINFFRPLFSPLFDPWIPVILSRKGAGCKLRALITTSQPFLIWPFSA